MSLQSALPDTTPRLYELDHAFFLLKDEVVYLITKAKLDPYLPGNAYYADLRRRMARMEPLPHSVLLEVTNQHLEFVKTLQA